MIIGDHSKAYATAAVQALFVPERPCCRRLCRVEKEVSHAGHECVDRDRFEQRNSWFDGNEREIFFGVRKNRKQQTDLLTESSLSLSSPT